MSTSQPITLTDQASSPDNSNESILTQSIRRLKSTTSLPTTTNTSNAATPRITFAPLPLIEPRKRRSTSHIKLGVAARSSMMRQRRLAVENLNNNGEEGQPPEWGGASKKLPPGSEIWQDEEMEYPRTKARSEQTTDSDLVFLSVGRLVKSAWRRVSQTQLRTSPSTPLNGSARDGDVKLKKEPDAKTLSSSEPEYGLEAEWEQSHKSSPETKQMVSVEEDEALGSLGNAPIHLELKTPVLTRSASEPCRKATTGVHV